MAAVAAEGGSFRDPCGFVFRRGGTLYRQLNESSREDYDALLRSGLYAELTSRGLLVEHDEADPRMAAAPGAYKVLQPHPIPFISYPYEWSFAQLKAAALATLEIQRAALAKGMTLKDASAFNVQFIGGRPIFIDTLSFERYRPGKSWAAYRQFCQHFLAPLALISYADARLTQLLRAYIDGVPLDLASRLLPWRSRLRLPLLLHVHLHAKSLRRYVETRGSVSTIERPISVTAMAGLIDDLRRGVEALRWEVDASVWGAYYKQLSYSDAESERKKALVSEFLDIAGGTSVWDLGSNTGLYSRIAAAKGRYTVAWELEPECVEFNYREIIAKNDANILPLVLDLANPTPSLGWDNSERYSVPERGPADTAMMLALVHHLAIGNNVPLPRIADFALKAGRKLIVEFVPKTDPMVQRLLASREDVFTDYVQSAFEAAFVRHFRIERKEPVTATGRVLYLMTSRYSNRS